MPPPLVGEALAVLAKSMVSPEAPLPGELSSVSETERLYGGFFITSLKLTRKISYKFTNRSGCCGILQPTISKGAFSDGPVYPAAAVPQKNDPLAHRSGGAHRHRLLDLPAPLAEISAALAQLRFWQVLLVLAVGLTYPVLEGLVSWVIIRSRMPGFTVRQALESSFMGTFGNVICLGAGAMPMQSYYLYRSGLPLGPGVGLMTLQYVFHKTTVLLYATVMLLLQHRWLSANTSGVMNYLPMAYAVVAVIIVALVLVCVSPLIQRLARWALGYLPRTDSWQTRREKWLEQLDTLGTESRHLLADKGRCIQIFALHTLKLFLMYTLPYLCIRFMGLPCGLSFWQVQLLASLMLFLSNALPNVAGMGSIETAFLLVFGSFLTRGEAMSTLMLFRIASYYFVFGFSAVASLFAQKHLDRMDAQK